MAQAFFFVDIWYIVLIIPALILSLIIKGVLDSTYHKYSSVVAKSGLTGAQIAERVLLDNGVRGVPIESVEGKLTDHYDPKTRVIRLSNDVYSGNSVAALGVAAHEAGHAVQHANEYSPLLIRNSIVPVVNFSTNISWWVFLAGLLLSFDILIYVGIALFALATLFHLITLPVEINASRRAVNALESCGALDGEEVKGTRKVLTAAALTYVAALVVSIASLLRMVLIAKGRRRR